MDQQDIKLIRDALNITFRHEDGAPLMQALQAIDRIEDDYNARTKPGNHTKSLAYRFDIDTSEVQCKLKELKTMSECISSMLNEHAHRPHVRIEFDDIAGVPKVWVDGKRVDDPKDGGLVELCLDWHTDDDRTRQKSYVIKSLTHNNGKYIECTESQEAHG